jgi:hypothetical protein
MAEKRPLVPTSTAIGEFTDQADRAWFADHPDSGFRTPAGEFHAAQLAPRPGLGSPVVLVIATRAHGRVIRTTRLLRHRLPAKESVA